MEYISNETKFQYKNTVVALGKFEGLHKGHQMLFDKLLEQKNNQYKSVVFTFDMPPKDLILGDDSKVIYTRQERRRKLEQKGIDVLIEYPFAKIRTLSAEEFIKNILVDQLDAKIIVIGEDFGFGYKRSGNATLLKELSNKYGYEVVVLPKLQHEGSDISSSRIREAIEAGDMELANQLLGEPFSVYGEVIHGRKLGRTMGIPTANQEPLPHKYLPPKGVYVATIKIDDKEYHGISNIGVKPTIDENIQLGLETFIFDFNEDIYGKNIEVALVDFERPEMKFKSLDELTKRMQKDCEYGREYFAKQNIE